MVTVALSLSQYSSGKFHGKTGNRGRPVRGIYYDSRLFLMCATINLETNKNKIY